MSALVLTAIARAWSVVHFGALSWIKARARAVYLWALTAEQPTSYDLVRFKSLAEREIDAIRETIVANFHYQDAEAAILSARLTRRYDPAQALNEATNRAIDAKRSAMEAGNGLTAHQLAALEVQKQTVERAIRDAR